MFPLNSFLKSKSFLLEQIKTCSGQSMRKFYLYGNNKKKLRSAKNNDK